MRNNGGGHLNHSLFWESMARTAAVRPTGTSRAAIDAAFGAFDDFKEQFEEAGVGRFGSGWAWLVHDGGVLKITSYGEPGQPDHRRPDAAARATTSGSTRTTSSTRTAAPSTSRRGGTWSTGARSRSVTRPLRSPRTVPGGAVSAPPRAAFALVGAALFVLVAGANLATPLYGVYREEFGFSSVVLTLVFATYQLVLCPSLIVFGQLSDRIGRRPVVAGGLAVAMVGLALFALADDTAWLFVARAVQGLAVGAASGAATAALVELAPAGDAGRAALVSTLAQAGGSAAGPLVGGALAQWAPAPETTSFVVGFVVTGVLLAGVLALPRMPGGTGAAWRIQRPDVPPEIRADFARFALTAAAAWAVAGLYLSVVPSYTGSLLDTSNLALEGAITAVMLLASCAAQVVVRGERPARARPVRGPRPRGRRPRRAGRGVPGALAGADPRRGAAGRRRPRHGVPRRPAGPQRHRPTRAPGRGHRRLLRVHLPRGGGLRHRRRRGGDAVFTRDGGRGVRDRDRRRGRCGDRVARGGRPRAGRGSR